MSILSNIKKNVSGAEEVEGFKKGEIPKFERGEFIILKGKLFRVGLVNKVLVSLKPVGEEE